MRGLLQAASVVVCASSSELKKPEMRRPDLPTQQEPPRRLFSDGAPADHTAAPSK
jgi:hypothetical protein